MNEAVAHVWKPLNSLWKKENKEKKYHVQERKGNSKSISASIITQTSYFIKSIHLFFFFFCFVLYILYLLSVSTYEFL